ncbi:MAG: FAD-dependent oxidoreductase [Ruminococcaceae bacterium]|nr:FAD-dependent oxidoreductase [Oscillospiraceae bacterium]
MNKKPVDIQIPVTIGGVTFKNPFFVASGPTTKSVKQLVRIEETGWAAASIKLSIDPAPYINRKPRYSLFKDRDALAFTAEKRLTFEEGLKLIRDAKPKLHDLKLMANITYAGDDGVSGWVNMAKKFEEAGADVIELNMCCPNMSYNMEMTSGGKETGKKQTGASMGQQAEIAAEIAKAVKEAISIPLFVKLTPEGGQIAKVAKALYEAGADAVGGTGNRLGMPPIDIDDPGSAFYHLQKEISMGCHCGKWLKPLAQRDTYEIRKVCGMDAPIMAAGGITNWRDAVEMILCGGNLLGVCAETLISGYDICRPMIEGLDKYMQEHGYTDLSQMRGLVVPQVRTANDVTIFAGYAKIKEPNLSAPCKSACPHHVPTQAYIQKIAKGEYKEAYDLITGKNPLQSICSFVCNHPCEDACIRGGYDSPVKIRQLKRFVLEYGKAQGWTPAWAKADFNGHKVAVIGAGPAGLSCASELRKAGYDVTVFEKEESAGGLIRFGIPDYVMKKDILDEEINFLAENGVKFEFGKELGKDITLDSIKALGYEAVFAAIGTGKKIASNIEGADIALDALDFLKDISLGKNTSLEGDVVVIGKGFAAMDSARSAARLGASHVTLVWTGNYPNRSYDADALALAKEEGIVLVDNASVKSVSGDAVTIDCGGTNMTIPCGKVIIANEYEADASVLAGAETKNGFIKIANARTNIDGLYCGGNAVRSANVITAIAAGKNAAAVIDSDIRGEEATLEVIPSTKTVNPEIVRERTGYLKKDNNALKLNDAADVRSESFEMYERVMTEEEAQKEASRCLNCGCGEGCQLCKTICTDFAPEIIDADTMHIRKEDCVACGMCFNRCPNGNIEMVDLGYTV